MGLIKGDTRSLDNGSCVDFNVGRTACQASDGYGMASRSPAAGIGKATVSKT